MEIKVSEIQALTPVLITNYDELKRQLIEKVDTYKNMVYSDENIKQAKADRAALNKLSKAIGDERKRIKDELLKPFIDFETKCKELETIVDEASKNIDIQVKAFEEKEDNEKLGKIVSYFASVVGEYNELLDFDLIFDKRWLNKTYSMNNIETDITHIIQKTKLDIETINGQIPDDTIRKQVIGFYFKNINNPSILSLALQEGKKYEETGKQINNLEQGNKSEEQKQDNVKNGKKYLTVLQFRAFIETVEQADNLKKCLVENKIEFEKI